jgi:2-methylcitrate dehydratase PrpD
MQNAALVNGTASHILDFDDLHLPAHTPAGAIGHPSAPVFPALLALAEARGISGRAFIAAFVASIETECRVGTLIAPGHYAAGWHSTATIGTFGAAAACAHMLHLDLAQWLNTLGIAGMQAAGLKSMFGTMCKSFQVGKAAFNGLLAANLAAQGFTSNPTVLECSQGFGRTQTTTYNPEGTLQKTFHILNVRFKRYASWGGTHPNIEGILRLKERYHLAPEQVKTIIVRVAPSRNLVCNIYAPETVLEGKFSLRFTAALALIRSDLSNLAFTEANIHDPALIAIRDRITVELVQDLEETSSEVLLTLTDGRELCEFVEEEGPKADKGQEWKRLENKFLGLTIPVLGKERADLLIQAIERLEDTTTVAEIAALCVLSA